MKVDKQELQSALEKVKPGLAGREIIEQSTSFGFMKDRVVTYNDEISISHPVKHLNITGAVKAEELYQLLNKVNESEIEVECEESQIKIEADKFEAGLTLQQEIRLPINEVGEVGNWYELPKNFTEALRFCVSTCSKDMSRPVLTCLHVRQDGFVEGSDGFRIIRYELDDGLSVETFLIPASSANEVIKYDITQVAEGSGWIHFRTEDRTVLSCRVFEDNYPDIEHLLEVEGKEVDLPASLSKALNRAQIFTYADSLVSINLKGKKMTIAAEFDSGWYEEAIHTRYNDTPIHFSVNPKSLLEIADKVRSCIIGNNRLKLTGNGWTYIIALM